MEYTYFIYASVLHKLRFIAPKETALSPELQNILHLPFLGFHAHFFIKVFCRSVPRPDVQGHLIAAQRFCLLLYIFKQAFPDVLPARLLVNSKVINEQRLEGHHIGGKRLLFQLTESIAHAHIVLVHGNIDGLILLLQKLC